jgi:hypothetical protein
MHICEICKREFKSLKSLQSHFSQIHKIKSEEYYKKYLKKVDEGICKVCNKPTKYKNITLSYHIYCSIKCQSSDPVIIEKRINKTKGDQHWTRRTNTGPNKGKTYEELHGEEKTKELKQILSENGKKLVGPRNPFYGRYHNNDTKEILRKRLDGKTYEEIHGIEKGQKLRKQKMKTDIRENNHRQYWSEYPLNFYDSKLRLNILIEQNFKCAICFKNIKQKKDKKFTSYKLY